MEKPDAFGPSMRSERSTAPCSTSKPDPSAPVYTIASRRWFEAPTSDSSSTRTTSAASKSFHGSGLDLFLPSVLSSPGSSDVRQTWNSSVLGLEMTTARLAPPSSRRSLEKQSSLEQSAKESASVKPICASSIRISSVSLVTGCCDPMQQTGGSGRGSLLNEYATATSSITSQACITSGRVMGTRTETDSPPSTSDASSIILRSSGGIASAGSASAPSPTARWTYPTPALTTRSERSGVRTVWPASLGWEGPAGY
mmetsp:Transcript_21167/g.69886  ORF Transcript_21167/g.69886 Transcript_21167/m.69886 type:complete len:255 (-) Transcript_21167:895-1659(-)